MTAPEIPITDEQLELILEKLRLTRNADFRSRIARLPSDAALTALADRFFLPFVRFDGSSSHSAPDAAPAAGR